VPSGEARGLNKVTHNILANLVLYVRNQARLLLWQVLELP